jgi:predicted transcriptional regulator
MLNFKALRIRAVGDVTTHSKGDKVMKRSRDVIISQILDICTKGASKTRIVYQANLNFRTINPYLDLLTKNGLINVKKEQTIIYETTPRGLDLLDNFKQIQDQLLST